MDPDRSRLKAVLEGVDGWLGLDEAWELHEAARTVESVGPEVVVVEIGSWKGRSTIALALGVQDRGGGRVYAIDPHTMRRDGTMVDDLQTVFDFKRNVAAAGVLPFVDLIVATSHAAREILEVDAIDVLFVDGSHELEDVRQDILDWAPLLAPSAVVAFNDPYLPGVYRALRELILKPGRYRQPRLIQNMVFFKIGGARDWSRSDGISLMKLRVLLWAKFRAVPLWPYIPAWAVALSRRVTRLVLASG